MDLFRSAFCPRDFLTTCLKIRKISCTKVHMRKLANYGIKTNFSVPGRKVRIVIRMLHEKFRTTKLMLRI